ncbi:MAG: hypothetical protein ACJ8AW_22200 [Rhodopila sp.]
MTFRPKPPPDELTASFKAAMQGVPQAVPEISQPPPSAPLNGAGEGGRQRKAPPVVQINLNVSEMLADIISDEAKKVGSTRRWLARLMKEAGYDVPDADLNPYMNVRRRRE